MCSVESPQTFYSSASQYTLQCEYTPLVLATPQNWAALKLLLVINSLISDIALQSLDSNKFQNVMSALTQIGQTLET